MIIPNYNLQIVHSVPGEFHWPPIRRGLCDGLFCQDPPCFARDVVTRTRCVVVYRLIYGIWRRIGIRSVVYEDHLSCGCKTCGDIKSKDSCYAVSPCPNTDLSVSFCYWEKSESLLRRPKGQLVYPHFRPGECKCCVIESCPARQIFDSKSCSCVCLNTNCAPGRVFNDATCNCDCPKGTRENSYGKCVGE